MLMLVRYPNEDITLHTSDGVITVRICGVRGTKVSVGVDAPPAVVVHRDDIKNTEPRGSAAQPATAGASPVRLDQSGRDG